MAIARINFKNYLLENYLKMFFFISDERLKLIITYLNNDAYKLKLDQTKGTNGIKMYYITFQEKYNKLLC